MPESTRHAGGAFCWADLATTDVAGARRFYRQLFGWGFDDVPTGGPGAYAVANRAGHQVAAVHELDPHQRAVRVGAHWLCYVAVADVDDAARRAVELGGKLLRRP